MRKDMERKELEYYLSLRYPVTVYPDPDGGFVGEIEELHGCMTQAETLDEIFQAIEDARHLWIKTAYDEGQNIPLPRDMEEFGGKFLTRIPKSLHRSLAHAAKREGVSLNQYVTSLLAAGVSKDIVGIQFGIPHEFMLWSRSEEIWGTTGMPSDFWAITSKEKSKATR